MSLVSFVCCQVDVSVYSVIKLYMLRASSLPSSGVFHCTFDTGKFHVGFDDRFQAESVLTLLGSGHQNLHETYQCHMYSRKLVMMDIEDARNM